MSFSNASPADLSACDREPIHIPGSIQPHGMLLVLREDDHVVMQASANVTETLGRAVDEILDSPLHAALGRASAEQVAAALASGRLEEVNPLRLEVQGGSFDCILHRHDGVAILELEAAPAAMGGRDGDAGAGATGRPLRLALADLQAAGSFAELCDSSAAEVRRLTGFERVMVYRFDEEGNGAVISEVREEHLDPYLGLHYPASDIPRQARELYLRNWLRIIPDATYEPVPIVPTRRPDTGGPLDLGKAVLRSVSPVHLEYLANMGVRGSMSISLVVRDRLWGLISCVNHGGPRYVPFEQRSACEVLGRLVSLQIAAQEEREAADRREARSGTERALWRAMRSGGEPFEALIRSPDELLGLVDAAGAAAQIGDRILTCGKTPPPMLIDALSLWLEDRGDFTPYSTSSLPEIFAAATPHAEVAGGLLSVSLPGSPRRRLIWFRPEQVHTVNWGGDPHKPAELDPGLRLHPRRSFEQWKQVVRLRSKPWSPSDREAAESLRRSAVEVDLARQVERQQRAVQARDDLVAGISHDLKNPLGVVGMEASRLARLASGESEVEARVRKGADRIHRSVERMSALIRDLLETAQLESGSTVLARQSEAVRELLEEALVVLRPLAEAKAIVIEEELIDTPSILVDRDRIFRVLSNLLGNAIKFTPQHGTVTLRTERRDGELLFTVADTGPGIPAENLAHVFDRFWQGRKSGSVGSGLGLPIARGIVEAHGGRIWVESPPASGARFYFTLPLA